MLDWCSDSRIAECLVVFAATLLHEDVATIAAGVFVVEAELPLPLAMISLFTGVVTGDFMLYGFGALARRIPWAQRLLIKEPVNSAREWLEQHLVVSVALCRVIPGVLFPTFIACGWFRLSFLRFALTTTLTAALYTPTMLMLAILLKETLFQRLGVVGWGLLLLLVVAISLVGSRRRRRNVLARISAARHLLPTSVHWHRREDTAPKAHEGMPAIAEVRRRVSVAERIPPVLFYIPFGLYWIYLSIRYRSVTLPSAANPMIEAGGLWGESKSRCMAQIAPAYAAWVAPYAAVQRGAGDATVEADVQAALHGMTAAGLSFPVVVKPDIGWQGYGVRLIGSPTELGEYMGRFPANQTVILQKYMAYDGEAGILYVRQPGEEHGRVLSITLRYFPYVVGDGVATLRELIHRDPRANWKAKHHLAKSGWHLGQGTHDLDSVPPASELIRLSLIGSIRVGGLYRDATRFITPALEQRFDGIARSMPEFHFGRFDIRFKSLERLQEGEDFAIIEVNGAGSEAIHMWDPDKPFFEAYGTLLRALALLFAIGASNRARGFAPMSFMELVRFTRKQNRLVVQYPPSG